MHFELLFLFWEDMHNSSAFTSKWSFSSSSPSPWQLLVLHLRRLCEPCERCVFIAGNWQSVSWYPLCSGCCFAAALRGFNQSFSGLPSFHALRRFVLSGRALQKLQSQGLKTTKGGDATSSLDTTSHRAYLGQTKWRMS